MRPNEEAIVHALYLRAYPTWASLPASWFFAHATLVAVEHHTIVGSTSCSIGPAPVLDRDDNGDDVMWGRGVSVDPAHRGEGLGFKLAEARLQLGRDLGLTFFVGMTWPDNKSMVRIFERQGCELRPERIENAYPANPPGQRLGLMYTKGL